MALFALTGCGGGSDGSDSATAAASVPAAKIPVTAHATGTSIGFHGVAWDGNVFVTVGDVGYATSPDGATWTTFPGNPLFTPCSTSDPCGHPPLYDIVWTGTQFVTVEARGLIASTNGWGGWQNRTPQPGTTANLFAIAKAGTLLVAVGGNPLLGGATAVSSDGATTWTVYSTGDSDVLRSVAWSGTRFVASGDNRLFVSTDGASWTVKFPDGGGKSVVWSGTKFVVVGSNASGGQVLTSADGISWTAHSVPTTSRLQSVAWSGTEFLAVGENGAMLSSPDGVTWTSQGSATAETLLHVAWFPTIKFVMTGTNGTIITSP